MTQMTLGTKSFTTAGSGVTFSNIPTSANGVEFNHLQVVVEGRTTSDTSFTLTINDSTTGYSFQAISTTPATGSGMTNVLNSRTYSSSSHVTTFDFFFYSDATLQKNVTVRNGCHADPRSTFVRWANTAVINKIRIAPTAGTFAAGAKVSLYGMA